MKCDPFARAQCPYGARCEAFAVYTDDSECAKFNQSVQAKPETNADRIRAMSDEELCKLLGEYKFCDICEEGCDSCTYNGDCDKRLLEWLQRPAEGCR